MTHHSFIGFDADLEDLIHEIAAPVAARAARVIPERPGAADPSVVYPLVFAVCKEALRPRMRGFRMCGCSAHCPRALSRAMPAPRFPAGGEACMTDRCAPRPRRCVIRLDIPLREFMRDIETPILRSVAAHAGAWSWRRRPFPPVRDVVESALCGRGKNSPCPVPTERLCEAGACSAFDPWERIQPRLGWGMGS